VDGRRRGRGLRAVGITSDNIPLSEPIAHADAPASPVADACTDPMVLRFIEAATAPNTRRAYESDLKQFLAWGGALPASSDVVARYLAAHATTHAVATLARHLVAIRRAHAARGLPDPARSELVRLTFRGIRRAHGRPQRRAAALTAEQVAAIMASLGDSMRDTRDRALLLIGFAGAFRRSELTAVDCKWIERGARADDHRPEKQDRPGGQSSPNRHSSWREGHVSGQIPRPMARAVRDQRRAGVPASHPARACVAWPTLGGFDRVHRQAAGQDDRPRFDAVLRTLAPGWLRHKRRERRRSGVAHQGTNWPCLGCARRQVHPSERSICGKCSTFRGDFVSMDTIDSGSFLTGTPARDLEVTAGV
jgi:hypothetical protein